MAQFRYSANEKRWTLYCANRNSRWHLYDDAEPAIAIQSLHGHIHESPKRGGHWKAQMGRTVCVRPGQPRSGTLSYVIIDLTSMEIERFEASTLSPMSTER